MSKLLKYYSLKRTTIAFLALSIFIGNYMFDLKTNREGVIGVLKNFPIVPIEAPIVSVSNSPEVDWNITWGQDHYLEDEFYSERPWGVALDSFGNIFITGVSTNSYIGKDDIFVVKLNSFGHYQWHRIYDEGVDETGFGIVIDSNNNIYIGGIAMDDSESKMLLIKYDNSGNYLWNITQEGNQSGAYGIAIDSYDNIYLTGFGNTNIYLVKYDNLGASQWNSTWDTVVDGFGSDIAIDSENNVIVTGTNYEDFDKASVCILNFSAQGELQRNFSFSSNRINWGIALVVDSEDNIFISGMTFNFTDPSSDLFVSKYNNMGTKIWENVYKGDWLYDIALSPEGNLISVGGVGFPLPFQFDQHLFQINKDGELLSNYTWGSSELSERSFAVVIDALEGLLIVGYTEDLVEINSDVILTRFNLVEPLEIIINSPKRDTLFGIDPPIFSITTISDTNIDTWYTLDRGIVNNSFIGDSGKINQSEWSKQKDGKVAIQFYVKNRAGRIRSDEVVIVKDTKKPKIVVNYPIQDQFFGSVSPDFNISINETYLDSVWYSLNGGVDNITLRSLTGTINQLEWEKCDDGVVEILFYGNDTLGLEGNTKVSLFKDTVRPHIIFLDLFPSDEEESSRVIPPNFTIMVIESNLESMGYSMDEGINVFSSTQFSKILNTDDNTTYCWLTGMIDREAWDKIAFTNITINFYAQDLTGNMVSRDIIFDKKRPYAEENDLKEKDQIVSSYQLFLIISIIGITSLLIYKSLKNKYDS